MALVTGKRKGEEIDATVTVAKRVTMSAVSTTNGNTEEADLQIARFFFESGIPLEAIKSDEFQRMIEAIAEHGPGLMLPTPEELGGNLLKERVAEIKGTIEEHKIWWKKQGCSILIDCRTNRWTEKTICGFFVSCGAKGIVFVKSVDATEICKNVDRVFKMVDEVVEEIGEENVVQVVTNDLENYKLVGKLLMEKRKRLWWTPCVAHCIGLMLEDFEEKLEVHKETISNGKLISSYVYSRNFTIALLHHFTKGKDLVKPTVNKSATSYLTLGCLRDNKKALMTMFTSEKWKASYFAGTTSGKNAVNLVMDGKFWENVGVCLKAANPLIKVLCLVTSDEKPAMGFIYEEMNQAKDKIQKAFKRVKRLYMPLLDIIDGRWDNELFGPLHATAYYLNPKFHYSPKFTVDVDVKLGLYGCLARMVPDKAEATKIDLQLEDFKNARNFFGSEFAKAALGTKNPSEWWDSYGFECQQIQNFAVRILSLACCSSGCVCNWSPFDKLHGKRRNSLKQKKARDVIFVMANSKLAKRNQARKAVEYTMDDLSSDDEWITEKDDVFYDEEELALDRLYSYAPIGNDAIKYQAGKDVFGDGNKLGDGLYDDDEDGASNATGYFIDGEGGDMEDEDYDDDHDVDDDIDM